MSLHDELITDLGEIFSLDDFGKAATWKPTGSGAGTTINGHFVNEFEAALLDPGNAETSRPFWLGKTSDVSAATHTSTITIDAVVYQVVGVQPYTSAITKLILSRDAD
jgi:hypothetical protein